MNHLALKDVCRKEHLQQRHYFYLNELQTLARDMPQKDQQRLPYELLSSLANSLLDGTVFEIVRGLKEIQQMTERQLFEWRLKTINSYQMSKADLIKRHKEEFTVESQVCPQNLSLLQLKQDREREEMDKSQEEETSRMDMKIITELDQTVSNQQVTLEKAGVPGFFVTNSHNEIRLQMYLLDFISRLCNKKVPEL